MRRSFALATMLALVACGGDAVPPRPSPPEIFFPRHGSQSGNGRLVDSVDGRMTFAGGCLWLETDEGERFLVLWPSDTSLGVINHRPAVLGPGRELLVETNGAVTLGGGSRDRASAERLVGRIPEGCAGEQFWAVSVVATRP